MAQLKEMGAATSLPPHHPLGLPHLPKDTTCLKNLKQETHALAPGGRWPRTTNTPPPPPLDTSVTPHMARGLQLCRLDVEAGTQGFRKSNLRRGGWQKGSQETEKEIEKEQSLPKNSVAQNMEGRGGRTEGSQSCP